jgi:hypothetical protein
VGERQEQPFQLSFNSALKVDFQGSRVTSDGGLVLVRELDEHLGFGELIARHLADSRGKNARTPSFRWSTCYGNRSTADWRATKI